MVWEEPTNLREEIGNQARSGTHTHLRAHMNTEGDLNEQGIKQSWWSPFLSASLKTGKVRSLTGVRYVENRNEREGITGTTMECRVLAEGFLGNIFAAVIYILSRESPHSWRDQQRGNCIFRSCFTLLKSRGCAFEQNASCWKNETPVSLELAASVRSV